MSRIYRFNGKLTHEFGGYCTIEDIEMNLWKERIWSLVENAGLLPEIAWRDDKEKDKKVIMVCFK